MTELEDVIALAKELGIELTEADFETRDGEMSEEELNIVAGGACSCTVNGNGMGVADDNGPTMTDKDGHLCFCSLCGWGDGEFF